MEWYVSLLLIKLFVLSSVSTFSEPVQATLRNRSVGLEENTNGVEGNRSTGISSRKLETNALVRVVIISRSLLPTQRRWKKEMNGEKSSSKQNQSHSSEDALANSTFASTKINAKLAQTPTILFTRDNFFNNTRPGHFAERRGPSVTSMLNRFMKTAENDNEGGQNKNDDRFAASEETRSFPVSGDKIPDFRPIINPFIFFKKFHSKSARSVWKLSSAWRTAGSEKTDKRTEEASATLHEQTGDSASMDSPTDGPSVRSKAVSGVLRHQSEGEEDGTNTDMRGALQNSSPSENVNSKEDTSKSPLARDEMNGRKGQVTDTKKRNPSSGQTKHSRTGGEIRKQSKASEESWERSDKSNEDRPHSELDVRTLRIKRQASTDNARNASFTASQNVQKYNSPTVGPQKKSHVVRSVQPAVGSAHDAPVSAPLLVCPPGRFGPGCHLTCGRCDGGPDFCDSDTGLCRAGCDFGWIGPRCLVSCGVGTWGDRCYGCGRCAKGDTQCNRTSGHCLQGCEEGWYGVRCRDECGHCLDGPGACHTLTGACLGGCKPGWQGQTCHGLCLRKTWGANCSKVCGQCLDDVCNSTDGRCMKGCNAGWRDMYCTTPCNGNSYGPNCSLTCGKCLGDKLHDVTSNGAEICNRETGACANGCQPGYRGQGCQLTCELGKFGRNCSQVCRPCPGGFSCACDPVTGLCTGDSCLPDAASSWTCESGRFGPSCQEECGHCLGGKHACHALTGICPAGCEGGWQGSTCHEPCAHQRWGLNCSGMCGYCLEDFCNGSDGRCMKGCRAGWKGVGCMAPCDNHTYGKNCARQCGKCRKVRADVTSSSTTTTISSRSSNSTNVSTPACHPETGECAQGCEPGYAGSTCEAACRRGKYGDQCARDCPQCPDGHLCICSATDGKCQEGGCLTKQASTVKLALAPTVASGVVAAVLAVVVVVSAAWIYLLRRQQKSQQLSETRPSTSTSASAIASAAAAAAVADNDVSPQDGAP